MKVKMNIAKQPKKTNYIDNEKFYFSMKEYIDRLRLCKLESKLSPKIPEYVGQCILLIANNLVKSPSFSSYSSQYKEEMIGDALENCFLYIHNFDPYKLTKEYKSPKNGKIYPGGKRISPFTYFTTIIYYAFIRRILKEKKQQYIRYKGIEKQLIASTLSEMEEDPYYDSVKNEFYESKMNTFIEDFEKKIKSKKEKE
jgi:hypothetical protein